MFTLAACLLLVPGQIETVESADYPAKAQIAAVAATVRIRNLTRKSEGSGVILGKKGAFVYVLTAQHVIEKGERMEVATFNETFYPRPANVYGAIQVVAKANDIRDLALLRVTIDGPIPGSLALCPARLVPDAKNFKGLTVGCIEGKPTCQIDEVAGKRLIRRAEEDGSAQFWEVVKEQHGGRSGGPLVDKRGLLLGICSGVNKDKSYYSHTEEISAFLERNGFDWLK